MKRLALVGVDIIHKFIYPGFINGFDRQAMERDGEWMADLFRGQPSTSLNDEVRVVAIASPDRETARRIAGATHIDTVVDRIDDLPGDLDGALVMERQGSRHLELAQRFLEAGQYVFFDKPVVESRREWDTIKAMARRSGSRVFGGSALRYSPQVARVRTALAERPAVSLVVTGPGPWYEYACHTVELLELFHGPAVQGVVGVGENRAGVAVIRWVGGAEGTVQWGNYRGEFRIDAYDREDTGHRAWIINDARAYYQGLAQAMVDGVLGKLDPDWEAIDAVVGVLDDVGRSLSLT